MKSVCLYTDGACFGNPGPGGWAAILVWGGHEKELCGAEQQTTNNQMELTAVIKGLEALKQPVSLEIITDSKYVMNGVTDWMARWKQNGWKTAARKPVANQGLWQRLDQLCGQHKISWQWVKGHSGHPYNERCDQLASQQAAQIKSDQNTNG